MVSPSRLNSPRGITSFCPGKKFSTILPHTKSNSPGRNAEYKPRSEEHTSELQSRLHLVCRLLLEKKKNNQPLQSQSNEIYRVLNNSCCPKISTTNYTILSAKTANQYTQTYSRKYLCARRVHTHT